MLGDVQAVLCGAVPCEAVLCEAAVCGAAVCGAVLREAVVCGAVMPEGDSVRRTADRLATALVGRTVVRSELRVPRHATADLCGAVVTEVTPRGKHLLTRFDTGLTLHTHQRMDGSWTVLRAGRRLPPGLVPDVRVLLVVDTGVAAVGLRMPVVELVATRDEDTVVGHLGPDVLAPDFDEDEAVRRLRADPRRPVVEALLDQRDVAGLGNLWAVETLYLRGVHPWRPVAEVDLAPLLRLAQRMMTYALVEPGQVTTGERRPGASHHVYGRAGRPCRRCGTRVAFRAATGRPYERETWWCPTCQPAAASGGGRPDAGGGILAGEDLSPQRTPRSPGAATPATPAAVDGEPARPTAGEPGVEPRASPRVALPSGRRGA